MTTQKDRVKTIYLNVKQTVKYFEGLEDRLDEYRGPWTVEVREIQHELRPLLIRLKRIKSKIDRIYQQIVRPKTD